MTTIEVLLTVFALVLICAGLGIYWSERRGRQPEVYYRELKAQEDSFFPWWQLWFTTSQSNETHQQVSTDHLNHYTQLGLLYDDKSTRLFPKQQFRSSWLRRGHGWQ
jgi:hypothetical protein